jgi:hypothetical protein
MSAQYDIPDKNEPRVVGKLGLKALTNRYDFNFDMLGPGTLPKLMELRGYTLSQLNGQLWVEDFVDPDSGAKEITAAGTPAVFIKPAKFHIPGDRMNINPARLVSVASDWSATQAEVLELLVPNPKERREVIDTDFRAAIPKRDWYFGSRYDGVVAIDRDPDEANKIVLPVQLDELTVDMLLMETFGEKQALEIVQSSGLPWKAVPITAQGEIIELNWHGQGATATETARYDHVMFRVNKEKRAAIALEVKAFRAQKLTAAGLPVT